MQQGVYDLEDLVQIKHLQDQNQENQIQQELLQNVENSMGDDDNDEKETNKVRNQYVNLQVMDEIEKKEEDQQNDPSKI